MTVRNIDFVKVCTFHSWTGIQDFVGVSVAVPNMHQPCVFQSVLIEGVIKSLLSAISGSIFALSFCNFLLPGL